MGKYKITLNKKQYFYNGNNCDEAMSKLTNRKVFGNPLVCNVALKMYDAETRGEVWAQYSCDGNQAMVEVIHDSSRMGQRGEKHHLRAGKNGYKKKTAG